MDAAVRPYADPDHDACRALWAELTEHHRAIYRADDIGGDDPGAGFNDYLALPTRVGTWVAVAGGVVVGLAGLLIDGDEGEIEPVVVAAAHRRTGIGAALVATAVDASLAGGAATVGVRPVARNGEAVRFLHALGFRTLGHVEMFIPGDAAREWLAGPSLHDRSFRF